MVSAALGNQLTGPTRRAVAAGGGIAISGILIGLAFSEVVTSVWALGPFPSSDLGGVILGGLAVAAGFTVTSVAFLYGTNRGRSSLGLSGPRRTDISYIVGLTVACIVVQAIYGSVVPIPESDVTTTLQGSDWLLFAVVAPLLINPAEELLFRGVVQSRFDDALPTYVAIVLAGLFFALSHLPTYVDPSLSETLGLLGGQTLLGVLFGIGYAKTDTLITPVGIHSLYSIYLYGALFLGVA